MGSQTISKPKMFDEQAMQKNISVSFKIFNFMNITLKQQYCKISYLSLIYHIHSRIIDLYRHRENNFNDSS